MAEIFGTEVMDNKTRTLSRCCFVNVCLPLSITQEIASYDNFVGSEYRQEVVNSQLDGFGYVRAADAPDVAKWMTEKSVKDYETMIPVKFYTRKFWCRISGQICLELDDFELTAHRLMEMCDRVLKGEFKAIAD